MDEHVDAVITHELGHNAGTPHTHDFCPPLDRCAPSGNFGQCQTSQTCINNGTIMSYCHLCSGGMANMVLSFHPSCVTSITNYMNGAACATVNTCTSNPLRNSEAAAVSPPMPAPAMRIFFLAMERILVAVARLSAMAGLVNSWS